MKKTTFSKSILIRIGQQRKFIFKTKKNCSCEKECFQILNVSMGNFIGGLTEVSQSSFLNTRLEMQRSRVPSPARHLYPCARRLIFIAPRYAGVKLVFGSTRTFYLVGMACVYMAGILPRERNVCTLMCVCVTESDDRGINTVSALVGFDRLIVKPLYKIK